ncbi:DUF4238 domain-containing protein [Halocalculus aciditolerans]|uniref:DUF4238 domain-containing protein n=1 Tax=Halocalculus aciditolerans TaxID=1383812 RepID=A0A830FK12_9EURY|nr:DUF4238 domain-containing protein [Halocalculus aciditolerans]GGL64140.1 hypothetical protein GCM10009039_22470 [Halocalculus aciditolerans]
MVEYKNQHYVPRFYLRNFSDDSQNIWLYNMQANREFTEPISRVCARDYFYSDETDVEKEIGSIESELSKGLGELLAIQSVSQFQTEKELKPDWLRVLQFLTFQEARTALSKEEIEQDGEVMFETFVRAGIEAGELDPELLEEVREGNVWLEHEQSPQLLPMLYQLHCAPLLADLWGTLLVNKTGTELVTSDHPVVRHNPYFLGEGHPQEIGLQSRGLQIYCPLTSHHYLLLHDPECYEIECSSEGVREIYDTAIINELNKLQIVNCDNNVFYGTEGRQEEMDCLWEQLEEVADTNRDDRGTVRTEEGIGVYTQISAPRFCPELPFVEKESNVEYQRERVEGALEEQEEFWEEQFGGLV